MSEIIYYNSAFCELNADASGHIPEWIELVPSGKTTGRDGRVFVNSEPDSVIAEFVKNQFDIPIDINHGSHVPGGATHAVGWIKELQNRAGKLFGRAEWTDEGKDLVGNKKFRGLSPALLVDRATGVIKRILSAGVTNLPNLFIPALNNEELSMATDDLTLALQQEKLALQTELNQVKTELIQAKTESTRLQTELNTQLELVKSQQTAIFTADLNSIFDKHADKVPPATRAEFTELAIALNTTLGAKGALKQVETLVSKQPVIGAPVNLDHSRVAGNSVALNTEEQDAMTLLGINPELYAASKNSLKTQFPAMFGAS